MKLDKLKMPMKSDKKKMPPMASEKAEMPEMEEESEEPLEMEGMEEMPMEAGPSQLEAVSDDDLLAEMQKRGLMSQMAGKPGASEQSPEDEQYI